MPKLKTNRLARKKFRKTGTGKYKKGQARTSHNTGKKSSNKTRALRKRNVVAKVEVHALNRLLPYGTR